MHIIQRPRPSTYRLPKLVFITLVTSLAFALISTIWAIYIEGFVHSEANVGFITAAFSVISLLAYILLIPFLEKRSKLNIYYQSLILFAVVYIIYGLSRNFYIFLAACAVNIIIGVTRTVSYGEIVRNQTSLKSIGKVESIIFIAYNISYLIGPIVAGYLSEKEGTNYVFFLAAFFILVSALWFKIMSFKKVPAPKRVHNHTFKNLKTFIKCPKVFRAYLLSMGIDFWTSLCYTFVPLFIINQGDLGIKWVGYYFSGMVIPLVALEYFFGKFGDKKGFKSLFIVGYVGMAASALTCFWLFHNIYAVIILLIVGSAFLAMVEATTEAYFFKLIPKNDEDRYYCIYQTAVPIGSFISKGAAALILLLLPWQYTFIGFAVLLGLIALVAVRA